MVINQGDVFWLDRGLPIGSEPGYAHPYVVVQNNILNRSRIKTVVVCLVTSNLDRLLAPGNVRLHKGEANLEKPSVINVSQIFTVDKQMLGSKIGTLSRLRIREMLDGIRLITEPRDIDIP